MYMQAPESPSELTSPACIPAISPKQPLAKGGGFWSVSRAVQLCCCGWFPCWGGGPSTEGVTQLFREWEGKHHGQEKGDGG